jgi:hypothetical protein
MTVSRDGRWEHLNVNTLIGGPKLAAAVISGPSIRGSTLQSESLQDEATGSE